MCLNAEIFSALSLHWVALFSAARLPQPDLFTNQPRPTQVPPAAGTANQERMSEREAGVHAWMQSAHAAPHYPHVAGSKEVTTSAAAAKMMETSGRAELLRHRSLAAIEDSVFRLTADECAAQLGETVLAVRPRISELNKRGLIVDTGIRRKNISGISAKVWRSA